MRGKRCSIGVVTALLVGAMTVAGVMAETKPAAENKPALTKPQGKLKVLGAAKNRKKSAKEVTKVGAIPPALAKPGTVYKSLFPVRMATAIGFSEIPIGEELGYFKEEGIEIKEIGVLKTGMDLVAVISGDADTFAGHPPALAKAILAGAKVKAVAPGMVDHPDFPHVQYLVREDSPIKSFKDIIGKKVAITNYSECSDGYLTWWLRKNNLPTNVAWVVMPATQFEQALKQGLVDMTTSHPPYAGMTIRHGGVNRIGISYDIVKSPAGGLSIRGFSEKFIKANPQVVKGFVRALYRSRLWINSNQVEAANMTARRLKMKPEDVTVFYFDEHPTIEDAYIQVWFRQAIDNKLWKDGAIKTTAIYTNDYFVKL